MVVDSAEGMKAQELIAKSVRDYLTAKITIPLGNPDLKNVHTNQFLWTELPSEMVLKNWEIIAEAFQSKYTRYQGSRSSGYTINRWYIEGLNIDVDVSSGKAEMSLDLNAFPSNTSKWSENYAKYSKAYEDAFNPQTSSTQTTTNATTTKSVLNQEWIKKYNIDKTVYEKAEKICNVNWGQYDNVKALFNWMDDHIGYESYNDGHYTPAQTLKRGKGNCCDNSKLFRAFCQSIGVKCNFIRNSCISHQYNKVYIGNNSYIVDVGRWSASWGSHWGSSGCPTETETSW